MILKKGVFSLKKIIKKYQNKQQEIISTYTYSEKSYVIIPIMDIEFHSLVVECDKIYLVRQTPLEIIDHSCGNDWTTYEGRREFIIKETGYVYKPPILIHNENIDIAIPTRSASHFHCAWINPKNILDAKKCGNICSIIFVNGLEVYLDVSHHTITQQLQRAYRIHRLVEYKNNEYNNRMQQSIY